MENSPLAFFLLLTSNLHFLITFFFLYYTYAVRTPTRPTSRACVLSPTPKKEKDAARRRRILLCSAPRQVLFYFSLHLILPLRFLCHFLARLRHFCNIARLSASLRSSPRHGGAYGSGGPGA